MKYRANYLSRLAAVALLIGTALATISTAAAQDGETVERVAVVTPGSRTNQGWDQQAADGMTAVAEELGIEVEVAENAGYEDITPTLRDLADQGADLIVCHASGYQTVCPEFAQDQNVRVAIIENPAAVTPDLISDVETQAQEVAYLAGVLAGELTETGTVAIVVSDEPPTWNYMTVGFAEGLHSVNPDANLLYSVIGVAAYDDTAGATRVTEQVLAAGADIVFGMGDGATFGMIQAIQEFNADEASEYQALFIDVIGDKSGDEYDDLLLTSVLFDYTGIYHQMIADIEAGEFGGTYTMDLENEGVRLLDLPDFVPAEVAEAVEEARQAIIAGEIEVSAIPDADEMNERLEELFPS